MVILEHALFGTFPHAISIMHRAEHTAFFKCSPTLFSIMVLQIRPYAVFTLKMTPEFFPQYACDQLHYVQFSIDDFYMTIVEQRTNRFSSVTLSIAEHQRHFAMEFSPPSLVHPRTKLIPTSPPERGINEGAIDYASFVSFDLFHFRRLVTGLENNEHAYLTITDSQIKFLVEDVEVVLTTQRNECIIGGFAAGEEFESAMCLCPWEFFYNFTSERLWLFKSYDPKGMTLIAPMGLYVHISSYFPEDFYMPNF